MPSVAQTIPLDLLLAFQFFHPFLFAKATTPKPSILRPGTKQPKFDSNR